MFVLRAQQHTNYYHCHNHRCAACKCKHFNTFATSLFVNCNIYLRFRWAERIELKSIWVCSRCGKAIVVLCQSTESFSSFRCICELNFIRSNNALVHFGCVWETWIRVFVCVKWTQSSHISRGAETRNESHLYKMHIKITEGKSARAITTLHTRSNESQDEWLKW